MHRMRFIVIVGETFDDLKRPEGRTKRLWLKRLLWWFIGISAGAILSHEIAKLL